jgi:hypothetical protein
VFRVRGFEQKKAGREVTLAGLSNLEHEPGTRNVEPGTV